VPQTALTPPRLIWARARVSTTSCPVSYVTAESRTLIEEFYGWKLLGVSSYDHIPARVAEAIFILEDQLSTERDNASETS
jgi:hypothetical protein